MRTALISSLVLAAALAVAAAASGKPAAARAPALIPGCAKAGLNLVADGKLTVGSDNPAFPPWFAGPEKKPWKVSDPTNGTVDAFTSSGSGRPRVPTLLDALPPIVASIFLGDEVAAVPEPASRQSGGSHG